MKKQEVLDGLAGIATAKRKWNTARLKFLSDVEAVMQRLFLEAAVNRMTAAEVGKAVGLSQPEVRRYMRKFGMNPKDGKTLLAKQAGDALTKNAALLGIEPSEMDLMSPLAYLPMGSQMRDFLTAPAYLDEMTPPTEAELVAAFKTAWHARDEMFDPDDARNKERTTHGIRAVLALLDRQPVNA